jgi:hypothetical protein
MNNQSEFDVARQNVTTQLARMKKQQDFIKQLQNVGRPTDERWLGSNGGERHAEPLDEDAMEDVMRKCPL